MSGDDPARQSHDQRDGAQRTNCRVIDVQVAADVNQNKRENGEVIPIQHPA